MSKSLKERDLKKGLSVEKIPIQPPGKPRFKFKGPNETVGLDVALPDLSTEEEFCQQLLVEGYVQSYVDFYHLTQRIDPNIQDGNKKKIQCSQDEMIFIRNNLVLAELSRRQGNTTGVYTAYNKLAASYKTKMDWKTAIFFQEKCLEVAQLTLDMRAEMTANHTLGEIYQQMNDFESAQRCHERHEEIATSVDDAEEIVKANVQLHKVYLYLASKLEMTGDTSEALQMYHMCLSASIKCMDLGAQGEANGKIGNLLLLRSEPQAALPYLKQHSQISADIGDTEGRCRASSSLAWALDSLGEQAKALTELNLVHNISEQAGDAYLQSQACRALGTLYSKVNKLKEAVDVLQRHFDLIKAILNQQLAQLNSPTSLATAALGTNNTKTVTVSDLEMARVYVGISKGNLLMECYYHSIVFDMSSLLDWKLNRTELAKPSTDNNVTTSGQGNYSHK